MTGEATEVLLSYRMTTDTGSVIELWELDNGLFELLFVERGRSLREVVHAVTVTPRELEILAGKFVQATQALAAESRP